MENLTTETAWNYLEENGIATYSELELITNINGYTLESLDSVVYARTEFNTVEQLMEEEEEY